MSAQELAEAARVCGYDSGSMYGNGPACGAPATHRVTYRNGSYGPFVLLVCRRHYSPMCGRAFPGVLEKQTGEL